MGWNRTGARETKRVQLETMDAGVTLKRWLAGERLEYEDRQANEATRFDITDDGMRLRKLVPSAVAYIKFGLTIVGTDGELDGFDPMNVEHVNGLTADTLGEILAAIDEYTTPERRVKRPEDRKPAAEADAEDPSPAQPTAPEGSAASQA